MNWIIKKIKNKYKNNFQLLFGLKVIIIYFNIEIKIFFLKQKNELTRLKI